MRVPDLTTAMGQTIDPMGLMQRVADRTLELIPAADGVMVGLADPHGVTYVCRGGNQVSQLGARVALDSSLSGLAIASGRVQRSDDTAVDPRVDADACRRLAVASLVCVPLVRAHETLGVLAVNATRPAAFSDDDVATLSELADFVSVVIGSACDLSRVKAQLVKLGQPTAGDRSGAPARTSADATRRYVMSVLSPDTVTRVDSAQRIQAVLD
ncbi:MAG TPA: GAF domain-containing protein, partial [Acidothermaceae bacterium]|nr:GAF domain-containing protein [Acidothermaceae bacterium]